jgi:DNA-binding MarR family transcriptional regulator
MSATDRSQYVLPLQARPGDQQLADARRRLDAACQTIAAGRMAARRLAVHARGVGLNEAEFRLLWQLDKSPDALEHPDQKQLATQLGLSAAQVSTVVERLRAQGFVAGKLLPSDRRRQLWRLSSTGRALLNDSLLRMIANSEPSNGCQSSGSTPIGYGEDVA